MTLRAACTVALALLLGAAPAHAMGDPSVAALQVALRARALYPGPVDGIAGAGTRHAVVRLQRRAGLPADGVVGPRTRAALGRRGRPPYGSRELAAGALGWDVAALQFRLAWHGFPSGPFDGRFGPRLDAALRRFQAWARLPVDGVAGRATFAALRTPPPRSPLRLSSPLPLPPGDRFGPRGAGFHPGLDFPAGHGTAVAATRAGVVAFTGPAGSYGRLVVVAHGRGVETLYGHLRRILVDPGERVAQGETVGLVGSTGRSTGPHLHFEVRVRGAAVDPLTALR